jgi:uncharacterized membrane protein AbrB (regulator of aidB expression)
MGSRGNDAALGALAILAGIVALPVLFVSWLRDEFGIPIPLTVGLVLVGTVTAVIVIAIRRDRKLRALQIANIDCMTGIEFERYLQKLLIARGYDGIRGSSRESWRADSS